MSEDTKCADLVEEHLESRLEDLRILWAGYNNENCPKCDGTGEINNSLSDEEDSVITSCELCDGSGKLDEENIPGYGNLNEYGLAFDYCTPEKENEGYFRYQISWGGPSEEFRIYADKGKYGWQVRKIDFWYLDWFDGAKKNLYGDDLKFMVELSEQFFLECSGDSEYEKAMEDYEAELDFDDEEETEE
jgi:hypothetical protein